MRYVSDYKIFVTIQSHAKLRYRTYKNGSRCSIRFLYANHINRLLFVFFFGEPHNPYFVDSAICHFQYSYIKPV